MQFEFDNDWATKGALSDMRSHATSAEQIAASTCHAHTTAVAAMDACLASLHDHDQDAVDTAMDDASSATGGATTCQTAVTSALAALHTAQERVAHERDAARAAAPTFTSEHKARAMHVSNDAAVLLIRHYLQTSGRASLAAELELASMPDARSRSQSSVAAHAALGTLAAYHTALQQAHAHQAVPCLAFLRTLAIDLHRAHAQAAIDALLAVQFCELLATSTSAMEALQFASAHLKSAAPELVMLLLISADLQALRTPVNINGSAAAQPTWFATHASAYKYFDISGACEPAWRTAIGAFEAFGGACLQAPTKDPLLQLLAHSDRERRMPPAPLWFHSVFVCPVLQEEVNLAADKVVLLSCGHCISQSAARTLYGGAARRRFKCPTCPTTTAPDHLHELKL